MHQLWRHAFCEKEGQIDDLVYEDVHPEVILFMYKFYKDKYPKEFYSTRHEEIELLF